MKKLLFILIAAAALTSCKKERDYLCTIEQVTPEGIIYHTKFVTPFHGTYAEMLAFQKSSTFGDSTIPNSAWQLTICR